MRGANRFLVLGGPVYNVKGMSGDFGLFYLQFKQHHLHPNLYLRLHSSKVSNTLTKPKPSNQNTIKWQVFSAAAVETAMAVSSEGNTPISKLPLLLILTNHSVLNTVDETTKGLPVVGGVTSPVLKTVGGVTDGLPIVGGGGGQAQQQQQVQGGEMTEAQLKAKKKKALALKKKQLELEAMEMEMSD
jgi:hypothetical protein